MNSVHQFSIEGIQPHLPIRLPCYDFTPIICPTLGGWLQRLPHRLRVLQTRGVTGGVQGPGTYSPRHADPRLLAIPASCRRVAPTIRTENGFMRLAPPRGLALFVPSIVARVAQVIRHDDLTSSPPSSGLSPAVTLECPT